MTERGFPTSKDIIINEPTRPSDSLIERLKIAKQNVRRADFISPLNPHFQSAVEGTATLLKFTDETFSTISQTSVVDEMLIFAKLEEGSRVLEIGTGSGYSAALTQEIVGKSGMVVTIERDEEVAQTARDRLQKLGYKDIQIITGDGLEGYEQESPYDAIIVTAACAEMPPTLVDQLADKGRMVTPITLPFVITPELDLIDRTAILTLSKNGSEGKIKFEGTYTFVPAISDQKGGWTLDQAKSWKTNSNARLIPPYSEVGTE